MVTAVALASAFILAAAELLKRNRKLKKTDISFVITDYSCTFGITVGHNLPNNDVFVDNGFHLDISGHFNILINNSEFADAYVNIQSIDTNWELNIEEMKRAEVRVEVPKPEYVFENPIILNGRNTIPKCRFGVVIPIRIPGNEQNRDRPFKFIGSLTRFNVTLGVNLKGQNTVLFEPLEPAIKDFHKSVEHQLIQLAILQAQQVRRAVPNAIFALRDLWQERPLRESAIS